ncbi:MAG: hypothetical protein FWE10_02835 [Rikenellaceae bacterium]|nr:hypothetical protein [Rikenellaceae bacterium]MCL2693098.1 hypothetical protein [Rikenellaceae bacterium]
MKKIFLKSLHKQSVHASAARHFSKYIALLSAVALLAASLSSCRDFLDVRPKSSYPDYLMFTSAGGYQDAVIGLYLLARGGLPNVGGAYNVDGPVFGHVNGAAPTNLLETMTGIQRISASSVGVAYALYSHNYDDPQVRQRLTHYYRELYRVVTNTNLILKWIDDESQDFLDERTYNIAKGETLGMKAFVLFDAIRAFGPPPTSTALHGNRFIPYPMELNVAPYENETYTRYMELLRRDVDEAERLLALSDPIVTQTNQSLNAGNGWLNWRQNRMNYYAVCALQARIHLWEGNKTEALRYARIVIEANVDGAPQFRLATWDMLGRGTANPTTDLNSGNLTFVGNDLVGFPELVFGLTYTNRYDIPSTGRATTNYEPWTITEEPNWGPLNVERNHEGTHLMEVFSDMTFRADRIAARNWVSYFESQDWRFLRLQQFPRVVVASLGNISGVAGNVIRPMKYNPLTASALVDRERTALPMLKLSEMYLIAAECEPSLPAAREYLNTLRRSRWMVFTEAQLQQQEALGAGTSFTWLTRPYQEPVMDTEVQRREWLIGEYAREFTLEGQTFFAYKRMGLDRMPYSILRHSTNADVNGDVMMNDARWIMPNPDLF